MGWSSGSELMDKVIQGALEAMPFDVEARKTLYRRVIPAFEDADWDTPDECMDQDPAFDEVFKEVSPEWFMEEDD